MANVEENTDIAVAVVLEKKEIPGEVFPGDFHEIHDIFDDEDDLRDK